MLELKIPPPVIALLCIAGMYFTRSWLHQFAIAEELRCFITAILFMGAFLIASMAILQFKKARTTIHPNIPNKTSFIVTSGIYKVTRNPMYLSLTVMVAASGVAMQHSAFVVFTLACLVYLQRYQILPEERILEAKFGEEYLAYKNTTRRWI